MNLPKDASFVIYAQKVFASSFNGIMFWIIFMSYVFKSSYVHAKTSLNSLNNFLNAALLAYVQLFPRLILFGFYLVPRFTTSYNKDELLVFVLVGLLNLS